MFKPVDSKVSFPELEEGVLAFWKERDIFRKSVQGREGAPHFIMYEGPPTANGTPGVHHVLPRVFKDIIPRYKTMQGFQAPRKGGWDTQGLAVELEIEKELGLTNKRDIEEYGIERFNQKCRESVFRYVGEFQALTDRIGFWIDVENAYVTFHNSYIETGWWIIKQLWDAGLVYQGYKTTPHCPRCGTSLSSHEVALGYNENTVDPSVYVKFRVASRPAAAAGSTARRPEGNSQAGAPAPHAEEGSTFVLAWTTTPWTLPGNTALAVDPTATYVIVEHQGERLILAEALLERVFRGQEYSVVERIPGTAVAGLEYEPLFDPLERGTQVMRLQVGTTELAAYEHRAGQPLHYRVISGDFVSMTEGTGVVHIAPAFGEDDFEVGKSERLLFVQHVDLKGEVLPGPDPFAGRFVKDADPLIIRDLGARGLLFRSETVTHTYPFCWRCATPLLYYVKASWYFRTTALKQKLIDGNAQMHWYPEHVREGRYGDWLENNVDWAISRERYWGTPLPIWKCEGCGEYECIGSVAELAGKPGAAQAGVPVLHNGLQDLDLHRPYVDGVTFGCGRCGGTMRRVPEVLDAWFDSGAMPYAQWHYPFENRETFRQWFPADYICEGVDQTRGWFYTLHALATLLNAARPDLVPQPICYRNVICHGLVLDSKGEKMSKSKGNVVDPWTVLNQHGADALRWYLYTASPAGNPRRFSADLVAESLRKFLLTLWNTYSFFVTYANIDGYAPLTQAGAPAPHAGARAPHASGKTELDRWVLSELNKLVEEVTTALEGYNPTDAARRVQEFVEDLSNWYVRRSRRRFWKSGLLGGSGPSTGSGNAADLDDKLAAYDTLYTCLVTVAKLIAPFTPFVAEAMYQNLVRSVDTNAPESVHLADYPDADIDAIDEALSRETQLAMRIASLGRAARSKAAVKVRQPLRAVLVKPRSAEEAKAVQRVADQIAEELNVQLVEVLQETDEVAEGRVGFNAKTYGQAFGRDVPELVRAVATLDPAGLGTADEVTVGRWQVPRAALTVEYQPKPGYAIAHEAGYLVALDTEITPELAVAGLARELVHRLQTMRKSAGFDIADSIETFYEGDDEIGRVLSEHGEYVRQETLSRRLEPGSAADGYSEEHKVDGHVVTLTVRKA